MLSALLQELPASIYHGFVELVTTHCRTGLICVGLFVGTYLLIQALGKIGSHKPG